MDLSDRPVSSVMRTEFVSIDAEEPLDLAATMMRLGRIRHLPVLEEGRLVGMISDRDLLAASLSRAIDFDARTRQAFLRAVVAREVMSRDVEAVEPETLLREVARRMVERKIGALPVVRENRVMVGLVTETDLLRAAYLEPGEEAVSVGPSAERASISGAASSSR